MSYSFDSRVRFSEADAFGKLSLYGMINYFQECATFQSEDVGFGYRRNKAAGQAWVIASMQVKISRYPDINERIRIFTWPVSFRGMIGHRGNSIETPEGELLAAANAQWVYMDMKKQIPMRVPAEQVSAYGSNPDRGWPEEMLGKRKIQLPEEGGTEHEPFVILEQHLDINGHVNNGQYVLMGMKYFPEGMEIGRMRLEFSRQAFPGDMLYPKVFRTENAVLAALCDAEGKPYFLAEAQEN